MVLLTETRNAVRPLVFNNSYEPVWQTVTERTVKEIGLGLRIQYLTMPDVTGSKIRPREPAIVGLILSCLAVGVTACSPKYKVALPAKQPHPVVLFAASGQVLDSFFSGLASIKRIPSPTLFSTRYPLAFECAISSGFIPRLYKRSPVRVATSLSKLTLSWRRAGSLRPFADTGNSRGHRCQQRLGILYGSERCLLPWP